MSAFGPLVLEAIRDAVRRRIVAVIVVVCVLSVMMLDSCTACSTGEVMVNGELRQVASLQGGLGALTIVVLGLWIVVLAGVLTLAFATVFKVVLTALAVLAALLVALAVLLGAVLGMGRPPLELLPLRRELDGHRCAGREVLPLGGERREVDTASRHYPSFVLGGAVSTGDVLVEE